MAEKGNSKDLPFFEEEFDTISGNERLLILHNDEEHTFDYVIESLVEVCDHTLEQAEQCTYIVHYKGKCDVKKGSPSYLKPMRRRLSDKGLKATID